MVFSYNYGKQKKGRQKTNAPPLFDISMATAVHRSNTDGITQCGMSRATPEAPGRCHWAITCSILPRRLLGQQANKQQSTNTPSLLAILRPQRCAGTILCALPDGEGPGLLCKPLDATIGKVLQLIDAIGHAYAVFLQVFSSSTCKKWSQIESKAPVFNRGIKY